MKSISLYKNHGSWLNSLHPYTKLIYVLTAIVIPLIAGKLWLFPIFIITSIVLLAISKCFKQTLSLIAFSFTIIIVIFLIQGLFYAGNTTEAFRIFKLVFYQEGVLKATKIGLNILNMLTGFAVFVLTTSPQELVEELEKSGCSKNFGYIINSIFQILPQMIATKDTIMDAQRSRGLETEGNVLVRAKAFFPLISPVVMSSLTNTRERAIALEVRGFGRKQKKTYLSERSVKRTDYIIRSILILLILCTIIWRVISCL